MQQLQSPTQQQQQQQQQQQLGPPRQVYVQRDRDGRLGLRLVARDGGWTRIGALTGPAASLAAVMKH